MLSRRGFLTVLLGAAAAPIVAKLPLPPPPPPAVINDLQALVAALEAGGYDARPSTLCQGCVLQVEDLAPVMMNVRYDETQIVLTKRRHRG